MVAEVESNGDSKAMNPDTSAAGAFQFVTRSVLPALNRLERFGTMPDWAKEMKATYKRGTVPKAKHRRLMTALTYEQQELMFLGDIFEKKIKRAGYGDSLIKKILEGDIESMKKLYFEGHHTDPDAATERAVKRIFK